MNKNFIYLMKLFVSLFLLFYLLLKIDYQNILEIIKTLEYSYIFLSIFLILFGIIVSSYKWLIILKSINDKANISLLNIIKYYFIGNFFNNFMPTSIGGDIFRISLLKNVTKNYHDSFFSVFMDRFTGFYSLIIIFIISSFIIKSDSQYIDYMQLIFLSILFLTIILFCFINMGPFKSIILKFSGGKKIFTHFLYLHKFTSKKKIFFRSIIMSLLFQIIVLLFNLSVILAFGYEESLLQVILIIPVIMVITMLPISFNGVGIRESMFILFLVPLGYSETSAFAIGFITYILNIIISLPGFILYIEHKN